MISTIENNNGIPEEQRKMITETVFNGVAEYFKIFSNPIRLKLLKEFYEHKNEGISLEELEEELQSDFEFIDVSDPDGYARLTELKIIPSYVPTVIIDCKAYIGVMSEEEYRELIEAI